MLGPDSYSTLVGIWKDSSTLKGCFYRGSEPKILIIIIIIFRILTHATSISVGGSTCSDRQSPSANQHNVTCDAIMVLCSVDTRAEEDQD